MSRFNLKKGDRFTIEKSESWRKIKVELAGEGDTDLDASTFLVGEDGSIHNDADFVYYNSEFRQEPFDRAKHGNKKRYLAEVRPMSADGSVLGSIDMREGGGNSEVINVDLDKVSPEIYEIIFVATVHSGENFGNVGNPKIIVSNDETGEELCDYALNQEFSSEDAVEVAKLICDEDGEWKFEAVGMGYDGGLETLIGIYAE